ncbi:MAG: HIT family protein [Cyclobacteriaceae bacterium]|jgi:histidine triad (HIT) family protein|nr:HIT family protein [Cyclobacteriaceae bacterium]
MPSIFTRIINREIPGYIVAEDERYIAFLDIMPLTLGHTLVVPKQEVDFIFDLDDDTLAGLHVFAKRVAHAVKKAVPCRRIGVAVIGLEVPHVHVHLVPMNTMDDLNFTRPKLRPEKETLAQIATDIKAAF